MCRKTKLHFEVQIPNGGNRSDDIRSVKKASLYPSFLLLYNGFWDDYGHNTWYCLYYAETEDNIKKIGQLKLMLQGERTAYEVIKDGFEAPLSENFCSVGIDYDYYSNLHRIFNDRTQIINLMTYLRDCAYDHNIYMQFQEDEQFQCSLFRDLAVEEIWKEGQSKMFGEATGDEYQLLYHFTPDYLEDITTDLQIKFERTPLPFMRTASVIGENGSGKTHLLRQLFKDLITQNSPKFEKLPIFNYCFAAHSSHWDNFEANELQGQNLIPYHICDLTQGRDLLRDILSAINEIENRKNMVNGKDITCLFKETICKYIDAEFIFDIFINGKKGSEENAQDIVIIDKNNLNKIFPCLSSGQKQTFSLITQLFAHIHYASLIIMDEPEVHMHPRMIMEFMKVLSDLLTSFQSYALIATHSPIIIRELSNKNVFKITLVEHQEPVISQITKSTFGEDISTLYRLIYGYDEYATNYTKEVLDMKQRLIEKNEYSEINLMNKMEEYMNLSINTKMLISDIITLNTFKQDETH